MKPIGVLVDTIYDNAGDKAIRIAVEQFLNSIGAQYEVVHPLEFSADDYSVLFIGGGHLLRDPGDPYYDRFRVPGNHVLNTVGVLGQKDLGYLNDYAYVSVRAEADRDRLLGVDDVVVAPCISMLLRGTHAPVSIPSDTIGFHFTSDSMGSGGDLGNVVAALRGTGAVCMPFTHYAGDERTMRPFSELAGAPMLPYMEPEELLGTIGRLRWLVTSSLHATIFAYMSDVPFLAFDGGAGKIKEFCVDRGLGSRIFGSLDDLSSKIPMLLEDVADFNEPRTIDERRMDAHCESMRGVLAKVGSANIAPTQSVPVSRLHEAVRSRDFIAARQTRGIGRQFVELREQYDVQKAELEHKGQLYDAYLAHSKNLEEQVRVLREEVTTLRDEISTLRNSPG